MANPFLFYLTRILRIVPALSYSEALERGSWFHKCAQFDDFDSSLPSFSKDYDKILERRIEELDKLCKERNILGDQKALLLQRERRDQLTTQAWYQAAGQITLPKYGTFRQYLGRSFWRELGREISLDFVDGGRISRITIDLLLYHHTHNAVWLVDFKTCSGSPLVRLETCPVDFQTPHYLYGTEQHRAQNPDWWKQRDVPQSAELRGMIHVAVSKPDIEFGQKDRNAVLETFTPKQGKNKGIPREEKKYVGEPVFENYLSRVTDWYLARNEYLSLAPRRQVDPAVNISHTYSELALNTSNKARYTSSRDYIERLADRYLDAPETFPAPAADFRPYGRTSPYLPFLLNPIRNWGEIIARERFLVLPDPDQVSLPDTAHTPGDSLVATPTETPSHV